MKGKPYRLTAQGTQYFERTGLSADAFLQYMQYKRFAHINKLKEVLTFIEFVRIFIFRRV